MSKVTFKVCFHKKIFLVNSTILESIKIFLWTSQNRLNNLNINKNIKIDKLHDIIYEQKSFLIT